MSTRPDAIESTHDLTGLELSASAGSVVPTRPGYYWLRHSKPLQGQWQPVVVDTLHGVLCFKKYCWGGWMAVSESYGFEWGPELNPPNERGES